MATRDGLAQIWYADENGVITGFTPTADNVASAIIDTYNEHYGTDINIWTPETKALQVGDTVPNWNTYEKIEMQLQLIAIKDANDSSIFGEIFEDDFAISTNASDMCYTTNLGGVIIDNFQPFDLVKDRAKERLLTAGYNITNVIANSVDFEVGQTIPDWSKYQII